MKSLSKLAVLFLSVILVVSLFSSCNNADFGIISILSANKATEGLEYTLQEDGTYSITGYHGTSSKIVIPAKYNDIPVTVIGTEAFEESEIQSVSGGANITEIWSDAFADCYILKSVNIKGSISTISSGAFENCTNLKTISLSDKIETIGRSVFEGCKSLERVTLPKNLTRIDNDVFSGCENLKQVVLPEALTYIGKRSFKNCYSLSEITIPKNVDYVDEDAFNTAVTITIEGSDMGWHRYWSDTDLAVYIRSSNELSDVYLKHGMYISINQPEYLSQEYIYIDSQNLEYYTWDFGYKFTYRVEDDTIKCFSSNGGDTYHTFTYDVKTATIFYYVDSSLTIEYKWYSPTQTIFPDNYVDY